MVPKLSNALAALLLATATLTAQTPPPQTPTYDIVSIHQNKSDSGNLMTRPGKASFSAENVTLGLLLYQAYHITEDHTSGLTGPIASARFDIVAKVSDASPQTELTLAQRGTMMIALLADRFKLKAHIESKILLIYELTVLPGGPKFKPAAEGASGAMSFGPTMFTGRSTSIPNFVDILTNNVDRSIADKTGLTGNYDLALKWSLDGAAESQNPPLFTALQEQLGLKLRPSKGPVGTLVIDHVEMPSEN